MVELPTVTGGGCGTLAACGAGPPLRRGRLADGEAGFTIMEMMVVVAIVGLMLAATTLAFQNVIRSKLRSAASHTAASLKHGFDKATTTGMTIRVAFDLDKGAIWIEGSADRVTIGKDGAKAEAELRPEQQGGRERRKPTAAPLPLFGAPEPAGDPAGEGEEGGEEGAVDTTAEDVKQLLAEVEQDQKEVKRAPARFLPIKGMLTKKVTFDSSVRVDAVVTPRLVEPVTEGRAYVYFFPQGHGEPAIIHLANEDDEYYSVVLHPLTGETRIYNCRYRIPRDFGVSDDKRRVPRGEICDDEGAK